MKPEETLDLLRKAHADPIQEAHYAAVRARVMAEIAAGRRPARGWWALAFLALAAAVLCLAIWPRGGEMALPMPVVRPPAAPAVARVEIRPAAPAGRVHPVHRKPVIAGIVGPRISQPLVVKMVTDDPNVVIYWVTEGTGE